MAKLVQIEEFLELSEQVPLLDVRSPSEFDQGHILGAVNIPLFSDEERKIVGTIYKKEGRQASILKGLEFVGPRQKAILELAILANKNNTFCLHCWRGGMRSASVAWLLELYGFRIYLLQGGYKIFRKAVLKSFSEQRSLLVLGGRTGANKTNVLKELNRKGEQTIDLEEFANHKGSSFGSIGEKGQPTQEQFENNLYKNIRKQNPQKKTWIEDESRLIGNKVIPGDLWEQMRSAPVVYLDISFEERTNNLVELYGKYPADKLISAIERIKKRLGPQHAKRAIEHIHSNELLQACQIVLAYYDKTYDYGMAKRSSEKITRGRFEESSPEMIAEKLIKEAFISKQIRNSNGTN